MPKEDVRPDTHAWFFAAKLYVIFVGAVVFAIGSDIYDAVQAFQRTYGG